MMDDHGIFTPIVRERRDDIRRFCLDIRTFGSVLSSYLDQFMVADSDKLTVIDPAHVNLMSIEMTEIALPGKPWNVSIDTIKFRVDGNWSVTVPIAEYRLFGADMHNGNYHWIDTTSSMGSNIFPILDRFIKHPDQKTCTNERFLKVIIPIYTMLQSVENFN